MFNPLLSLNFVIVLPFIPSLASSLSLFLWHFSFLNVASLCKEKKNHWSNSPLGCNQLLPIALYNLPSHPCSSFLLSKLPAPLLFHITMFTYVIKDDCLHAVPGNRNKQNSQYGNTLGCFLRLGMLQHALLVFFHPQGINKRQIYFPHQHNWLIITGKLMT